MTESVGSLKKSTTILVCTLIWVLVNIVLSATTDLYADEAYYWMYSEHLDWGYFDHPPAVAFFIKLGSVFGKSEFGVRIINILLVGITLHIIGKEVKPKNVWLFYVLLFSSPLLLIVGFVSLPDSPFFLFNILFLLAFKSLIERSRWVDAFLVGLCAALMIYSKYHGGLVIIISILAVPKVLKSLKIYVSGLFALLLLAPHVLWQWKNGFPSISYHLVDRASASYKASYTLEFLGTNIFFIGGVLGLLLIYFAFKRKSQNSWERILKWNLIGTFVFFVLISFKGQSIEANWTLPAVFPLFYFGYKSWEESKYIKVLNGLSIFFFLVFLVLRIHLIAPLVNLKNDRASDFHGAKEFVGKVVQYEKGKTIATNNYQEASLINFYGDLSYKVAALNVNARANQYSLWRFNDNYCDESKDYLFVNRRIKEGPMVLDRKMKPMHLVTLKKYEVPECNGIIIKSVRLTAHIKVEVELTKDLKESDINKLVAFVSYYQFNKRKTLVLPFKKAKKTNSGFLLEGRYSAKYKIEDIKVQVGALKLIQDY